MPRKEDILVEIPDEDLPKVATFYKKHVTWAPHIVSLIHTGISRKKNESYKNHFAFFSVENTWERDGTIIILETNFCYNISVFTLDEGGTGLYRGLTETKLLDYGTKNAVFFCVHEKHIPLVSRAMDQLKLKATKSLYSTYTLPPRSNRYDFTKPEEIYSKKLDPESAGPINSAWSCKFEESESYIKTLIELNAGFGVFLKSTDQMVAWILRYSSGHIGLLQTERGWTRKGFGALVTRILVEEIVKEGHWPFATISTDNSASVNLFEKLGFRTLGECAYFTVKN